MPEDYVEELSGRVIALQVIVNVLATEFAHIDRIHLARIVRVLNDLIQTEHGIEQFSTSEVLGYTEVLTEFVNRGSKTLTTMPRDVSEE